MSTIAQVFPAVEPDPVEEQLADDYVELLSAFSRVDTALREGSWETLRDELDQVVAAAEDMWNTLAGSGEDDGDEEAAAPPAADAGRVGALVARHLQQFPVPARPEPVPPVTADAP
ncbi:hypothetical protein I5Q34_28830 [Streptomyces sp. AV19]|uniref:hypothetical protein n=1 Tax=Streptomyces sp. AV19 TaxID=2793068 RepID=UPI0018FE8B4A|nr:hypothetical protein [Streptomyces sp. AV19]MBH1938218.1 hypothetical protein [Streptomyces sp. AV19]MDG4536118.1 hypothetical protein [Streptomyces sp. AV19]